jgi:hypothetical protein
MLMPGRGKMRRLVARGSLQEVVRVFKNGVPTRMMVSPVTPDSADAVPFEAGDVVEVRGGPTTDVRKDVAVDVEYDEPAASKKGAL